METVTTKPSSFISKLKPPTKLKLPNWQDRNERKENLPGLKRRSKSVADLCPAKKPLIEATKALTISKPASRHNKVDVPKGGAITRSKSSADLDKNIARNVAIKRPPIVQRSAPRQPVKRMAEKTEAAVQPKVMKPAKPAPYDYKARYNLAHESNVKLKQDLKQFKEKLSRFEEEAKLLHERVEATKETEKLLEECKLSVAFLKTQLNDAKSENNKAKSDMKRLEDKIENLQSKNGEMAISLLNAEDTRRYLHNVIQDLKGKIRVFCRVRNTLPQENDRILARLLYTDEVTMELIKRNESLTNLSSQVDLKHQFSFDRVFPPSAGQQEVFEDLSQLVQSVLDGYNVCVFAYGQTGSGKTYTMQGTDIEQGMIPRSVELLFDNIVRMQDVGVTFEVQACFLEIYNETIRDLLNPTGQSNHEIRYNDGKEVSVSNLKIEQVQTANELFELMKCAQRNRATAATNINEHSSRSHMVNIISIQSYNPRTREHRRSKLNLIDLAGSESAKSSERMTETKNINKSLSNLGTVMLALANKDKHVPYRNSKLTYLLQPSLGGNSKTLMFVNIAPFEDCYYETINSLRFAAKVKEVKLNSNRNRTYK